jgi:pimeloyl-ACP methyl ester carboxylesterase
LSASSTALRVAQGPGSVSEAPNLPDGFTDTFTSRYVDIGALRLHAVIGGDGPPLLLVHGWPQTWYAWRLLMPALAENFEVIAVDQRGIGLSEKPRDGYDTGALAGDMVAVMDALGHQRFAVVGCDTGLWIGYALAADHPDRVDRVALGEAPLAGVSPSPPLFLPPPLNQRLWHIPFNSLPEVNEQLVRGREEIFFGSEFSASAGKRKLPDEAVKYYVDLLAADPEALRGSFELYRCLQMSQAQNEKRKTRRLAMPVLAIGGAESLGEQVGKSMKLAADDVQTLVIPDCAHWLAEQAPEAMLAALIGFLAPYRDGWLAARNPH